MNTTNTTIAIVDDDTISRQLVSNSLKKLGYKIQPFENGNTCIESMSDAINLVILDIMMPGKTGIEILQELKNRYPHLPVIMLSAQNKIETALQSIKLGATDYLEKPVNIPKLELCVKNALENYHLHKQVEQLQENVETKFHFENIISQSGIMQEVFRLVQKAKESDISVLVWGESGTGKELIARALHFNGKRKTGPFIAINCASIPHDLLESEMFGYERGAFTGAVQKKIGRFEQANGGTIFLDEIGEMDMSLQAKLLRIIQSKQFERVGGTETLTADVRIISATNKNLQNAVNEKKFREDLYYRLSSFPIILPPLRERREDIIVLAEYFLKQWNEKEKTTKKFSQKVLKAFYNYNWPGNVRELENAVERAVLMSEGKEIVIQDLPLPLQMFMEKKNEQLYISSSITPLEKIKEQAIRNALVLTKGNILEAAKKLKIGRATFYRLMKKYKIEENTKEES